MQATARWCIAVALAFLCFIALTTVTQAQAGNKRKEKRLPLEDIVLPDGFQIEVYADRDNQGLISPRFLKVQQYQDSTIVYVGTSDTADRRLRALIDNDNDNKVDSTVEVFRGPSFPLQAVAINPVNGNLYSAEPNVTYKCEGNANEQVLNGQLPLKCNVWFMMPYNVEHHSARMCAFCVCVWYTVQHMQQSPICADV